MQSQLRAKQKAVFALIEPAEGLNYDSLAGIPLATVTLTSSTFDRLNKPQITLRMDEKTHGRDKSIDGVYRPGKKVLLIDDLITQVDNKLEAVRILTKCGLKVKDVLVVLDRQQGGVKQLKKRGYRLHSVLKIRPLLKFYCQRGMIT